MSVTLTSGHDEEPMIESVKRQSIVIGQCGEIIPLSLDGHCAIKKTRFANSVFCLYCTRRYCTLDDYLHLVLYFFALISLYIYKLTWTVLSMLQAANQAS